MGRVLITIVVVAVLVFATTAIYRNSQDNPVIGSSAQVASVLGAVETMSSDFNEVGTLIFYPNNVGPVPYLFYQDEKGATVAKALTFPDSLPANFSSWTGARITVTGHLDNEHVVVSRIAYISGP